ncbi:MAG: DMT family transporter [Caldilinea sp.]|nr:DMT family transporter [Caldilinea sp.]
MTRFSHRLPTAAGVAVAAPWFWYAAALAAHTGWGIYPVLGRYLQTVAGLPSMSVLVLGGIPMTVMLFAYVLPRYGWRIYAVPMLWSFGAVTVMRSITNILSQRFTLAIYVQLVGLLTPFLVVLLNRLILQERPPRHTLTAISLSTAGALLMMSQGLGAGGLSFALTSGDWLGIGLAFGSSLFLALYMILVRRTAQQQIPGEAVLVFQTVLIQISALAISLLIGENWGQWLTLNAMGWAVFAAYVLLVVIGANGLQIASIRHLGAPLVSSLMGWRLVSTLVAGMLLLGEHLTSPWQALGMIIVLVTVTWYLSGQRR